MQHLLRKAFYGLLAALTIIFLAQFAADLWLTYQTPAKPRDRVAQVIISLATTGSLPK